MNIFTTKFNNNIEMIIKKKLSKNITNSYLDNIIHDNDKLNTINEEGIHSIVEIHSYSSTREYLETYGIGKGTEKLGKSM